MYKRVKEVKQADSLKEVNEHLQTGKWFILETLLLKNRVSFILAREEN